MLFKSLHITIVLLVVLAVLSDALKPPKVKKRKPRFVQESEARRKAQARSTYVASASLASESSATRSTTKAPIEIEVLKEISAEKCPRKTKNGDVIIVNYIGSLADGTVFDSSFKKGKPSEFELGAGIVLPSWDEGLKDMCIGEVRQISTPADLKEMGGAAGNKFIFKIELSEIKDYELPEHIKRDEL